MSPNCMAVLSIAFPCTQHLGFNVIPDSNDVIDSKG